ncbi:hypothetical protein EYF80_043281 [Liparis tanakae]|uniref:Uncharacterized protein n=1 Tax=Liparis tanakae TaxID=230148 RepID=A0A4Z2FZ76_9TELE|nr:hypothetical protein EYF80_043281 [Liparis tanakae]
MRLRALEDSSSGSPAPEALLSQRLFSLHLKAGDETECLMLHRVICVGDAALPVAAVGAVGGVVVAGLAEDGAVEAADGVAAPEGPVSLGRRGRGGEDGVDVGDVLQLRLQGLVGHGCHLEAGRRGPDLQDGSVFLGA